LARLRLDRAPHPCHALSTDACRASNGRRKKRVAHVVAIGRTRVARLVDGVGVAPAAASKHDAPHRLHRRRRRRCGHPRCHRRQAGGGIPPLRRRIVSTLPLHFLIVLASTSTRRACRCTPASTSVCIRPIAPPGAAAAAAAATLPTPSAEFPKRGGAPAMMRPPRGAPPVRPSASHARIDVVVIRLFHQLRHL